jgi:hypothetical protein
MYYNGYAGTNRFTIYKNGYVRKMVVYGENNTSQSCYQLNKVRKMHRFVKDYRWDESKEEMIPTGKYRKIYSNERIMIDTHRDRVVYLCNYILKNYYRSGKMNLVGKYTMKRVSEVHNEWWRNKRFDDKLPFYDGDEHELALEEFKKIPKESFTNVDDIQVIINGHRYNLV